MADQIKEQKPQQSPPTEANSAPGQNPTAPPEESRNQQTDKKEKPGGRRTSVFLYLVVLFAAAFTMLFMAYLMQQRANDSAISSLQDSLSSFESIDELLRENQELQKEISDLQDELSEQQSEQDSLNDTLDSQIEQNEAMRHQISFFTDYARLEYYLREEQFENAAQAVRNIWSDFRDTLGSYIGTFYGLTDDGFGIPERLREIISQLEELGYLTPGELDLDVLSAGDHVGLILEHP